MGVSLRTETCSVPWLPFVRVCGLILVVGFLGACSSSAIDVGTVDDGTSQIAYSSEINAAFDETDSSFVRRILGDGKISDSEFMESQDGLISCLREQAGEPYVDTVNGFRQVTGYPKRDDGSCSEEWDGGISDLFNRIKTNPGNENFSELVAACLIRIGVAPDGFRGVELEEMEARASEIGTDCHHDGFDENGDPKTVCTSVKPVEDPNPLFPSGESLFSDKTQPCFTNPLSVGLK